MAAGAAKTSATIKRRIGEPSVSNNSASRSKAATAATKPTMPALMNPAPV